MNLTHHKVHGVSQSKNKKAPWNPVYSVVNQKNKNI